MIYLRTVVLLSFVFVENAVRALSAHHGSETLDPIEVSLFLEKQRYDLIVQVASGDNIERACTDRII